MAAMAVKRAFLTAMVVTVTTLGCAKAHPTVPLPPSAREFHTAPEMAMRATVRLVCDGTIRGLGTAYGSVMLVTAYHVVDGCASVRWLEKDGAPGGHLINISGSRDLDWALMVTHEGEQFQYWTRINLDEPANGERLWSLLFLPGEVLRVVSDVYIGTDNHGDCHTMSIAHPGSSGSGIYNGDGELVGIVSGFSGIMPVTKTVYGSLIGRVFPRK